MGMSRLLGWGFFKPSTSQQADRGQATVFTLTPQDAQTSNAVIVGTLPVCYLDARILFDPGTSYSFVSPIFSSKMEW